MDSVNIAPIPSMKEVPGVPLQQADSLSSVSRPVRPRFALLSLLRYRRSLVFCAALAAVAAVGFIWVNPYLSDLNHLRAARSETRRFHNQQAIRHLQPCIRRWPNDPEVLLLAARAARRARNYAESEQLLGRYQQTRGLDEEAGFEQLLLSVERNVDRTGEQCRRLVEAGDPRSSLVYEALTRGYFRQYQLKNARACLDRWRKNEPDCAQAYYLDGLFILDYLHAQNEAEKRYREALDLDPDHEEARLGLALILVETRCFADAIEHIEFLRKRQPDNLGLQTGLAECRAGIGEIQEAVRILDVVLAEDPDWAPALAIRGRLALENGEYEEAESLLRRAIALAPGDRRTRHNLVNCLNQSGKIQEALRHQKENEEREKDIARFDDIVANELPQKPRDPELHCTLGRLLLRGGYTEEGLRWLNSALKLDPHYAPARQALTEYHDALAREKKQQQHGP
jgi:tetratricopeptide (TPR) repeat protein